MEIQAAITKINQACSQERGNTVELIERPHGGISIVSANAFIQGVSSRAASTMVVHRIINLLTEGVRDGAAIRAVSTILHAEYSGKATASVAILSVDMVSKTIVISRNDIGPILIIRGETIDRLPHENNPIGSSDEIRPLVNEIPIEEPVTIIFCTCGVLNAGKTHGLPFDFYTTVEALMEEQDPTAQDIAEFLLQQAVCHDQDHPEDDMAVVVMKSEKNTKDAIRRLSVKLPIDLD